MRFQEKPRLEILLSTKDDGLHDFISRNETVLRRPDILYTIVIQGRQNIKEIMTPLLADHITIHCQEGYGISRSRNEAIRRARGDIALICDDDIELLPDADKTIAQAFKEYPDADIITFQYLERHGLSKSYAGESYWHTRRSLLKVSSVEITFSTEYVRKHSVAFDEQFGLGSSFPTAEENIFLIDALKDGARILYYPKVIAIHHGKSPPGALQDPHLMRAKGAMIGRLFPYLALIVCLGFAAKKYPHYRESMTFIRALRSLRDGYKLYSEKELSTGETGGDGV